MKTFLCGISISMLLSGCAIVSGGHYVSPTQNLHDISMNKMESYARDVSTFLATGSAEQAVESAKQAVASTLKDPESAKFKNVRVQNYYHGFVICGEVNGKNSYGGYTGYSRFVASTKEADLYNSDTQYPNIRAAANAGVDAACP